MAHITAIASSPDKKKISISTHDDIFEEDSDEGRLTIPIKDIFAIKKDQSSYIVYYASYPATEPEAETASKSLRPTAKSRQLAELRYNAGDEALNTFFDVLRQRLDIKTIDPNTHIHAILNPVSGSRTTRKQWQDVILPMLLALNISESQIHLHLTQGTGDGSKIAADLASNVLAKAGYPIIILSIGGDGTLHEVINGMSQAQIAVNVQLGIVPSGSGNAYATALGISDPADGILRVLGGKTQPLRTIRVSFGQCTDSTSGQSWHESVKFKDNVQDPRIMVVFSWGFHAQIVSKSEYLRPFMGNSRFSLVAGFLLWWMPRYAGNIVLKDSKLFDSKSQTWKEATETTFMNGNYSYFLAAKMPELEPGFRIAPLASTTDDYVDLVLLKDGSSDELKSALYRAFDNGNHIHEPKLEYLKTKELYLRVQHSTEVCLDGEIHKIPKGGVVRLEVVKPLTQGEIAFQTFI
ncbi:hypothetical protein INT43_002732 [Umbelopsis isabellina]|uniref:DAGKc domain-containing protein n=1 Tax=Mortierella isabellina TaxID=91625 RepID=A0A8H7UPI5_MORIS|nr:hypothetical protein INT43_002732 [Umbelopsis isabellina]